MDYMAKVIKIREKIATAKESEELARNARPGAEVEIEQAKNTIVGKAATGRAQLARWGQAAGQPGSLVNLFGDAHFLAIAETPGNGETVSGATGKVSLATAENVLVAMHEKECLAAAKEAIRRSYENYSGLIIPPAEKQAAIEKAEAAVFVLEQQEESAIEAAEAAGMTIQRRIDASPEAVLGLKRGAPVPHNWRCAKFDRLVDARDAVHARMDAAREQLLVAQGELANLERALANANLRYPEDIKEAEAEVATARETVEYRRQVLDERMGESEQIVGFACSLEDYVKKYRQPKACRPMHNPFKTPEAVK